MFRNNFVIIYSNFIGNRWCLSLKWRLIPTHTIKDSPSTSSESQQQVYHLTFTATSVPFTFRSPNKSSNLICVYTKSSIVCKKYWATGWLLYFFLLCYILQCSNQKDGGLKPPEVCSLMVDQLSFESLHDTEVFVVNLHRTNIDTMYSHRPWIFYLQGATPDF